MKRMCFFTDNVRKDINSINQWYSNYCMNYFCASDAINFESVKIGECLAKHFTDSTAVKQRCFVL